MPFFMWQVEGQHWDEGIAGTAGWAMPCRWTSRPTGWPISASLTQTTR